jgi:predicted nucleic acid-binding protein
MTVLLDNTILSNFSLVQRPDLVRLAFIEAVVTTTHVLEEMQAGITIGKIPACDWSWLGSVTLMSVEQGHFQTLAARLGQGEASCLAVAAQRGYRLATDDRDARRWARQLGVSLTGTVGILAILVKKEHITLADGNLLLEKMITAGYRSPIARLEMLL